ncbi:MAG: glycosyltransferase [Fimbriimonadaceae bacterium]|nr:glycosyltransferase [Fimbriimonadaceae bacterium]
MSELSRGVAAKAHMCNTTSEEVLVAYVAHDDQWYLAQSIESFATAGRVVVFVSSRPWSGSAGPYQRVIEVARTAGADIIQGEWAEEGAHRKHALAYAKEAGCRTLLIPDGDEVVEPGLLDVLLRIGRAGLADRVGVAMDTYWKSPEYAIRPRERIRPFLMLNPQVVEHEHIRAYRGGRQLILEEEYGLLHHLSYVLPNERIVRKTSTWSHKHEVAERWFAKVWTGWDADRTMRQIHPTHPEAYGWAERRKVPEILASCWTQYRAHHGDSDPLHPPCVEHTEGWPSVSVVIPLYGGPDDIERCLDSLGSCRDLLHEVIVVDDASPDDAASVVERYEFARLTRNEQNLGFGPTCNRGILESDGAVVLLLNSDAIVPRAGLVRLIQSLTSSGSIAAAGPLSNRVGHHQLTPVSYTNLDNINLFAEDFAMRGEDDQDVDMLVGFCLAVKRSALDEVGLFDPRFGLGMFEDNDLCYRLRRAGYRLVISKNAFVHHAAHQSLERVQVNLVDHFEANEGLFLEKWKLDLQTGFASQLSGRSSERIAFDEGRRPEKLLRQMAGLKLQADISLCMIVRNEERVLEQCLRSAGPFFSQIVVVDTGSTDNTVRIARDQGADVHAIEWPDSFAEARNESLRHARGRWVFWMDADDTLPWNSGEAIVRAALDATAGTTAFVVPVRFVNDDPIYGTVVDHVKLFRNLPQFRFEGRIHEQIVPSIRRAGGHITRLGAEVLHSGYDTSSEGQARKRHRDYHLLSLELKENPEHPFVLFNWGMTTHFDGKHEDAVDWFNKCLAVSKPEESHVRKAYALKALSLRELGRTEEAMRTVEAGLAIVPGDPELLFHKGVLHGHRGEHAQAIASYERVVGADIGGHFSSIDVGILGFKTHLNLANVHMDRGAYAEGKRHFREAIRLHPGFVPAYRQLFRAALEAGDVPVAKECVLGLQSAGGLSEEWIGMTGELARAIGGVPNELRALRELAASHPHSKAARLVLARRLLSSTQYEEASGHLEWLAGQGVAEGAFHLGALAQDAGDVEGAVRWLGRAHELNPDHGETLARLEDARTQTSTGPPCPPF